MATGPTARQALVEAQTSGVAWALGDESASSHLKKRIAAGDLPRDTPLEEYEELIHTVVNDPNSAVYRLLDRTGLRAVGVTGEEDFRVWLIVLDTEGQVETAFPVENPESYFENDGFEFSGSVSRVLRGE